MKMRAYIKRGLRGGMTKRLKKKEFKEGDKVLLYNLRFKTFGKGNCKASGTDLTLFIWCSPVERQPSWM
jgi:hypothetical protein